MPPPSGAPFRALHPYQFAPAEYNPLMPSPDHPPNAAPHPPPARSEHSGPSEPHDRNHSPHTYYSHPPPAPAHASSSRTHYQSPPSPQFRTHAVNWGLPPIASSNQQQQQQLPPPSQLAGPSMAPAQFPPPSSTTRRSNDDAQRAPQAAMLYAQSQQLPPIQANPGAIAPATRGRSSSVIAAASSFTQSANVPRLPPIMQVEKQQVTTSATQAASASRRRNEANFVCPVPGCGSTFTRRFNLRGAAYVPVPIKRMPGMWEDLQSSRRAQQASYVHKRMRSDGGADCRQATEAANVANRLSPDDEWENASNSTERSDRGGSRRSPHRSTTS
uniref:Hormone-sensitive lipase n=1 Tax=Ganoderma boninense TaxID=34458 RepID=A0A5K1JY88_9APHY|nr:Hormone-sensitive lipase [Ganoderma boninense]